MSLDMFPDEQTEAIDYAQRVSKSQLPATFGDTFAAAWSHGALFGQSIAGQNARRSVIGDRADQIYEATGDPRAHPAVVGGDVEGLNRLIAELGPQFPDAKLVPLADDEIQRLSVGKSQAARADAVAMAEREKTFGGSVGGFLGEAAAQLADPVNIVALPLAAPASLGIIGTALAWGGVGVATQAGIEVVGAPYREKVQPGYGASAEPAANMLGAAIAPAVLGGGLKALSMAWGRARTGEWPQSVRDAGKVVDSEANIAETNPFPGAEGEVAHRSALTKAMDDMLAGRPVEVEEIVAGLRPRESDEVPLPGRVEPELDLQPPRSIVEPAAVEGMGENLTAARRREIRADPETDDAVAIDLDRLRATKDVQIPFGETIDQQGQRVPLMRSADAVMAEIDARVSAAEEIKLCATPTLEPAT